MATDRWYSQSDSEAEFAVQHNHERLVSRIARVDQVIEPSHSWWKSYSRGERIRFPNTNKTVRVVDLFCGPGGLSQGVSLGLKAQGHNVSHQFAADTDEAALKVFAANHRPRYAKNLSVAELVNYKLEYRDGEVKFKSPPTLENSEIRSLAGAVDLLIAGPPCQGHSTANQNRRYFDARNLLYLSVPAIAIALGVPTIIIENVPGVTASHQGVVQDTWKLLAASGYHVTGGVIDASSLGWAQKRRRHFTIARKSKQFEDLDRLLGPLTAPSMPISMLLEDLCDQVSQSFMTELSSLTPENAARIDFLHDNDLFDLPDTERNPAARQKGTTYRSVYGRMHWDRPSQTITTGFMTPGRGRYIHPLRRRTLTPLEAARLQGFPDTYEFAAFGNVPTRTQLAKWIGDAVPAPLGFAAAMVAYG